MPWLDSWRERANGLKAECYALWLALRHPDTPWSARIIAGIVVAYAFSPIDLIPDFVPVLGYLDDLILVPLGVALALRLVPPRVMADCRAEARSTMTRGGPATRWVGVAILAVWLIGLAAAAGIAWRLLAG